MDERSSDGRGSYLPLDGDTRKGRSVAIEEHVEVSAQAVRRGTGEPPAKLGEYLTIQELAEWLRISRGSAWTMDFDGTDRAQLTYDSYSDSSPVYSPDGKKIAFTSTRISGNSEVYTMGPSGGNLANITNDVADDYSPDWQPVDNTPPADTASPAGTVLINGGKPRTASLAVTLRLDATDPAPGSGVASMRLKNAGGSWTAWQPHAESKGWKLTRGAGKKTVYAQYRDAAGNVSANAPDSITYRP